MAPSLHRIDCRKLPPAATGADAALPEVEVPSEVVTLDVSTHAAWGGGLSVEQYLCRERVMRATAFSRRGLTQWVLRDGATNLASLETFDFDVACAGRRGVGHGIASVYVEPAQRGHGHATALCKGVQEAIKRDGGLLILLMSEVGPKLYERLGYVARPLFSRRYAAALPTESHGATPPWRLLYEADVAKALAARKLPARPLRVEISAEHALWHMTRSRYYAAVAGQKTQFPVGAQAGEAMTLWAPDTRAAVLRILTLYPGSRLAAPGAVFEPRSPEAEALRNVLHAARTVAGELDLPAIEVWENLENAAYLRGGARSADVHELPMLLGLQPGVRGEDWLDYERAHWI
jgi:GNAT superfamily N-acetyltransferase